MEKLNDALASKIISLGRIEITGWDLIVAILILITARLILFGIKRWMMRYNRKRIQKTWDGNSTAIFQLLKYVVWCITSFVLLDVLHVNLSFLVAGSAALLVGIGFGLQQIFQDIISGIFMLIERNVKTGDVMEVDDYIGRITHIGLRTSSIITRDGTNIIVPNHKFITNNVLNWSHAEQLMRFRIGVGVAYGSNVSLVTELLKETAMEHPDVVEDDEHLFLVRLVDFAESSIRFELLFWTTKKFKVEDVKSELRYAVLNKFNKNGIKIPFPQRDLHIKSNLSEEISPLMG